LTLALLLLGVTAALLGLGLLVWQRQRRLARLATVAQQADNAVLILDAEARVEWVNEGFARVSGKSLPEVAGQAVEVALLGDSPNPKVVHQIRHGLASKKAFPLELMCAHRSGHRFWLALTFTPVFDDKDRFLSFIVLGFDTTARRRSVEEVSRGIKRAEAILSAIGDGIVGLDLQGRITFANPAVTRLTGWEATELGGQPVSLLLHQLRLPKKRGAQNEQFLAAAFQDGTVYMGDADLFKRKHGPPFPAEYTSTAWRDGQHLVGSVLVFRDATERNAAASLSGRQTQHNQLRADLGLILTGTGSLRDILHKCVQSLARHLEAARAGIWTLETDGDTLELRASAGPSDPGGGHLDSIALGAPEAGVVAQERAPRLINELPSQPAVSDADWVRREELAAFAGLPLLAEERLLGVVGVYFKMPQPPETLEVLGAIAGSIANTIARRRVEETVVEQAALLDKSQDAILVMDLSNRVTYWNKSAERLYGWPAAEVQGRPVEELIFRDISYFERAKREALEKGEWKGETCQVTRGDEPVVVDSQWTLVQDKSGRPKSILIVNTDISEKKKIEAQFLRTQRMESIGTLAGGIAHDLNNVLAPIMMSVEMLKEKFKDDQSRRMLSILESSARRGADMVKQVLTFARGVDGERVLLQTRHLLKEVAKITGETFPKTIQIKTNLAENLWPIMGDATQLHQVLVNLAVNARDAMPNGGTLTFAAENTALEAGQKPGAGDAKPGFYVVLKVGDTGSGIPREILDKIFEPFFTTKELGKGTGLGLATVLGIVKSHGGFVQVQTEVGKGTTFLIYLPALENAGKPQDATEVRKLPTGNGEVILAVDDEASVLSMTKETLETYGYRVLTARDGTEAVATYSAHRHEIKGVLTDMLMPYMDGPATIRVLRKLDPEVKIIAASGLMDNEKVKDATGMANIAFLMKPYTAEKLLHTLHKTLTEPH
jgi:PAS domain S-box-containing protein